MDAMIHFPNLNIHLDKVGRAILIGKYELAFNGIIVALSVAAGILFARREARRTGQDPDIYLDLGIVAIITSMIGARLYYVLFSWDLYKNHPISIFYFYQGGMAIYGAVFAGILTAYVFARVKKLSFPLICDTAGLGLVLGQIIGRWGNFFNREAFGGYTDNIFAMQLPVAVVRSSDITQELWDHMVRIDDVAYIQVHPMFLYESMWNLGLLLILMVLRKHKKFDGEIFLLYLMGYGIGRSWMETMRTDQLMIPGLGIPVSMVVSIVLVLASGVIFAVNWRKVNRIQA